MRDDVFFDAETFGADKLVVGLGTIPFETVLRDAPLPARAQENPSNRDGGDRLHTRPIIRRKETAPVAHEL